MAGQTLTTTILINAKADNSLEQVGSTLMELGAMVDQISQQAQEFGRDSLNVYKDFEESMAEVEGALSTTYGAGSAKLSKVMDGLNEKASEWASTTIFHTDDVANAIADAAHAGWDYETIVGSMPSIMRLAQAGNIDLSEAVSYTTAIMEAAGIEVQDLSGFIDEWAFAANSSRGTIDSFGETMTRMQSTMRFAKNSEELMTLIALTADAGSTGSEAGTMIRNAILRLAAPTKKGRELMDELGASYEEANEIFSDESLAAANERLKQFGFSMYDENGQMKGVLDTFDELYLALDKIAGDNPIDKDANTVPILESLFGKRGVTEGLNILRQVSEDYNGLYDSLMNGEQEGYAAYLQELMAGTIGNKIELFKSKFEELQKTVGEALSPDVESAMNAIGGVIDKISGIDDTGMAVFTSGLETIAGLGPGLLLAGGAISTFGKIKKLFAISELAPAILGISAFAAAATGAVIASKKLWEIDYESKFGSLKLDNSEIVNFANGISEEFNAAYDSVIAAQGALDTLQSDYENKSSDLMKNLITDAVTGKKWTSEDKQKISTALNELIALGIDNIDADNQAILESLAKTFEGDEDNPVYSDIQQTIQEGYDEAIASAEGLSQQLLDALFSAFEDGEMTSEKLAKIQDLLGQFNDEIIAAEGEEAYVAADKVLRDAQRLGLEGIKEISEEIVSAREATLEPMYRQHARDRYRLEQEGGDLEGLVAAQRLEEAQEEAKFNIPLLRGYMTGMAGSDLSGAWQGLVDIIQSGDTPTNAQWSQFATSLNLLNPSEISHLQSYISTLVDAMGGVEGLTKSIDLFSENGQESLASDYKTLLGLYNLADNGFDRDVVNTSSVVDAADHLQNVVSGIGTTLPELANISAQAMEGETINWDMYGEGLESALRGAAEAAGTDISTYLSDFEIHPTAELDTSDIFEKTGAADIEVPVTPVIEGGEGVDALAEQNVSVPVDAETDAAQGQIDALGNQDLTEYVDGDTAALSSAIDAQDHRQLIAHVSGDTSALSAAINAMSGKTIYVNVAKRELFASGGRATSASIFGEAGPEWAIPEEHSQRTAELLNAAREASGFTWPDLLARFGGFNSNPDSSPATVVYSPTINANDASGVDAVLREDKFRLERWFEERQMKDRMEVYA